MNNSVKISVALFLFDQDSSTLRSALDSAPSYDLIQLDNSKFAVNILSIEAATLVIASVNSIEDFIQLSKLVKEAKKNKLKIKYVVATRKGQQFDKYVAKLDIIDFIDLTASTKALRYKVDFLVKSFSIHIKNSSPQESQLKIVSHIETKEPENIPVWTGPLNLKDDMWYTSSEKSCRKIMNRWLVCMIGPSPLVGRWVEAGHSCWEFKFKSIDNPFCSKEGSWYYKGKKKPDFIWKENIWLFSSDQYELFYKTDSNILTRVSLGNRVLTICKNSEFALLKRPVIIESFDSTALCEADVFVGAKDILESDLKKLENLRGTAKTSKITDLPLSGKQKTTDHVDGKTLSGYSTEHLNLSGPDLELDSSDQDVTPKELSLKKQAFDGKSLAFNNISNETISNLNGKKNESLNNESSADSGFKAESKSENTDKEDSESSQEAFQDKVGNNKKKNFSESQNGPLTGKGKISDLSSSLLALGLEKAGIDTTKNNESGADSGFKAESKNKNKNKNADKEDAQSSQEKTPEKVENNKKQKFVESQNDPLTGKGKTSDLSSPLLAMGLERAERDTAKKSESRAGPGLNNKNVAKEDSESLPETSQEQVEKNTNKKFLDSQNGPLTGKGKTSDLSRPMLAIGLEKAGIDSSQKNLTPSSSLDDVAGKSSTEHIDKYYGLKDSDKAGKEKNDHKHSQLEVESGKAKSSQQNGLSRQGDENKKEKKISNDDGRGLEEEPLIEMSLANSKGGKVLPMAIESQKAEALATLESKGRLSDLLKKAVKQYKLG